MYSFFNLILLVIIIKIKCQQVINEEGGKIEKNAKEKVNYKTNIDRRFLDDLGDYEWHVAHLRSAILDGRRDCMDDTFADKVRRYRRMLKNDGALVEYVSSDPIPVDPSDIVEDSCKFVDEPLSYDLNVTKASTTFINVTNYNDNISPTTVTANTTTLNTTVTMKIEETIPIIDHKATTVEMKVKPIVHKKKKPVNDTQDNVRRASEYMFSSIEYYDESIEFDASVCPDAVEVITLEIDQLRSYDLECEMTLEWRSLE